MPVAKPTLYLETTIPSYLTARPSKDVIVLGHQLVTQDCWGTAGESFAVHVSPLVLAEASKGDPEAASRRLKLLEPFPLLSVTDDAVRLAGVYLSRLPVPSSAKADALHLALASIHAMDYLVTWNCKHIAHGAVRRMLPEINNSFGIPVPTICTPEELLHAD